jgi:arsenite oxidase small subunit
LEENIMTLSRREFVLIGAAGGATLAGGLMVPLGMSWDRDEKGDPVAVTLDYPEVEVGQYSALTVGVLSNFAYPAKNQSNLLVRVGKPIMHGIGPDSDVVAYSNLCTHMGCPITEYQADEAVLGPCPCHYTAFDLAKDGQPAFGQATQNLPRVMLRLDGDKIFATGIHRPLYGHSDPLHGVGVELLQST